MCFRIVSAGDPHIARAMLGPVEAAPSIQARIALLGRYSVEGPLDVAGLGVAGLHITWLVQIVARANNDVAADHHRRHRGKILLVEVGDLFVPAFLAGLRVQTHQIVVRRLHVEPVAIHSETSVSDVRAASGLPEVVPQNMAVARIRGPGIVGHREIKNPVDFENRSSDGGSPAETLSGSLTSTLAANETSSCRARRHAVHPG